MIRCNYSKCVRLLPLRERPVDNCAEMKIGCTSVLDHIERVMKFEDVSSGYGSSGLEIGAAVAADIPSLLDDVTLVVAERVASI